MKLLYIMLATPIFGAFLMMIMGGRRSSGIVNIAFASIIFFTSLILAKEVLKQGAILSLGKHFYLDSFSIITILLTTFIAATTAFFSHNYMWHNVLIGKITGRSLRIYHVMYQLFIFMILLALSANNIGIIWVAMEGATLTTVLLVSLYRTKEAIEAAWKYFILCIVGIALALFGTILVYAAATQFSSGETAILWSFLREHASSLNAPLMKIAFAFLLVGYGTKIGLVPLHNWLPDAYSESPAPISVLLSGLFLNVALYALVRFKILIDLTLNTHLAGNLMICFGLLSFLIASILLNRQSNLKRMLSYSSIEHMGLITMAFGFGSHLAIFSALFYMLMHALTKSAIFVVAGKVTSFFGGQKIAKMHGLFQGNPLLGWMLIITSFAICGFPPFGIFLSEVMLFIATLRNSIWFAFLMILGCLLALAGILRSVKHIVYGEFSMGVANFSKQNMCFDLAPAILHLALVFIFGVYLPSPLNQLLQKAVSIINV